MKNIAFITLAVLILSGCKKEKSANPSTHSIIGKWNLVVFSGGIAGGVYHPNGTATVEFNTDRTFKNYTNNFLSDHGTYQISPSPTLPYANSITDSIIYYSTRSNPQSYVIKSNDTLILADHKISDGYIYKYVRIK